MAELVITRQQIEDFLKKLQREEKSQKELVQYRRELEHLYRMAEKNDSVLTEAVLMAWKTQQIQQNTAPGTVTNRIVRVNHFLRHLGREELCFPKGNRQKLSGQRFGNLLVLEPLQERAADRSILWKCRCMLCGREKTIPANQLKKGVQSSCGCERMNRLQKTNGYMDGTSMKNVFSDKVSRNNISGNKGVFQKRGKWAAKIQYKKKIYYLGTFDRLEDAIAARRLAENRVRDDAKQLMEAYRLQEHKACLTKHKVNTGGTQGP